MLNRVEYAINNSIHSSTKQTPSILLFGVAQRGPQIDTLTEYLEYLNTTRNINDQNDAHLTTHSSDIITEPNIPNISQTDSRQISLTNIRSFADNNIKLSQRRNEIQYKNRSSEPQQYKVGDYVMIRNVDTTIGQNKKLIPKYRGPYMIHRVLSNDQYVIRDIPNLQITQIPYDGVLEAARIKHWIRMRDANAEEEDR